MLRACDRWWYALLIAIPAVAGGQSPTYTDRPWSVTVQRSLGGTSAGGGLEQSMRLAGYSGRDCFLFCVSYPFSTTNVSGWTATAARRFYTHGTINLTVGTAGGSETFGTDVGVISSVTSVGLLAGYRSGRDHLWVAGGPALYRVRLSNDPDPHYVTVRGAAATTLGVIIGAGLRFPSNAHPVFVEIGGEYRAATSVQMGPLDIPAHDNQPDRALPATSVNFSHFLLSAGLGIRLGGGTRRRAAGGVVRRSSFVNLGAAGESLPRAERGGPRSGGVDRRS